MTPRYNKNNNDSSQNRLRTSRWTTFLEHRNLFLFGLNKDTLSNSFVILKCWISVLLDGQNTMTLSMIYFLYEILKYP